MYEGSRLVLVVLIVLLELCQKIKLKLQELKFGQVVILSDGRWGKDIEKWEEMKPVKKKRKTGRKEWID